MTNTNNMDDHKMKAMHENILYLRYECGMHESLVARRLQITVANLRQIEKRFRG